MKLMLEKAISMQGDHISQARQAQQAITVTSAEHAEILEALEFKISSLEQQCDSISKKLTVLISLLCHSICQEDVRAGERAEEKMGTSQGTLSPCPRAVRAKALTGQESSKNYIVLKM